MRQHGSGRSVHAIASVTQRQQANVQWFLQEKTRRQELYHQFIEEASKLYVDALIHDEPAILSLVSLYASINKMSAGNDSDSPGFGGIHSFETISSWETLRFRHGRKKIFGAGFRGNEGVFVTDQTIRFEG